MKNMHLIPPIVTDLCESALDIRKNQNERNNYYLRISAVRDYCDLILKKIEKTNSVKKYISVSK
jgi:hypothetical protein